MPHFSVNFNKIPMLNCLFHHHYFPNFIAINTCNRQFQHAFWHSAYLPHSSLSIHQVQTKRINLFYENFQMHFIFHFISKPREIPHKACPKTNHSPRRPSLPARCL